MSRALLVGANSAIAQALHHYLLDQRCVESITAVARQPSPNADLPDTVYHRCDYSEAQIAGLSGEFCRGQPFRYVFIFNGILHGESFGPEKRLEELDPDTLIHLITANTITPLLWLKHLAPMYKSGGTAHITALSARIGSITDNGRGGWYGYRASKAALNMMLKTAAVEYARRGKGVKLVAFHPGTTDSPLSAPFQRNVPPGKLFSAAFAAERLFETVTSLPVDGELSFLDWQGKPIDW